MSDDDGTVRNQQELEEAAACLLEYLKIDVQTLSESENTTIRKIGEFWTSQIHNVACIFSGAQIEKPPLLQRVRLRLRRGR